MATNEKQLTLPSINVNVPVEAKEAELVKPEQIIGFYNEIMNDIRADRQEIDEVTKHFQDIVINGIDVSTSAKESLVNLMKLKSDTADKKTKVVDLLLRAYLKQNDNFPRYLAAHQENTINIDGNKRKMLKAIITEAEKETKQ